MILGVDASRMAGLRTGVARCMEQVLSAWSREAGPFTEVRAFSREPVAGLPEGITPAVLRAPGPGLAWAAGPLRRAARHVDVLVAPYTLPPLPPGPAVVWNLGIYEGPERFSGLRARGRSLHQAHSARRASAVAAVSEGTRDDVIRWYGADPERVHVVWPGRDERFRPAAAADEQQISAAVARALGAPDVPFVLFVGKLSARRRVAELIAAFAKASASRPQLRLLLLGPNTTGLDVGGIAASHGAAGRVVQVDDLGRETLILLFRAAEAFAMPASSEGFSLTILEALASGTPVLAVRGARLGVLEYLDRHHHGGAAAAVHLAADGSAGALAQGLAELLSDAALRARLKAAGPAAAASFPSWEECAADLLALAKQAAA